MRAMYLNICEQRTPAHIEAERSLLWEIIADLRGADPGAPMARCLVRQTGWH